MINRRILLVAGLIVGVAGAIRAGSITYDEAEKTILVAGFGEDTPCALSETLAWDKAQGRGLVRHDPDQDIYTINANLQIGTDGRLSTYFLIGTKERPREQLVLTGNLVVPAPALRTFANVLQLGSRTDDSVTPTLTIRDSRRIVVHSRAHGANGEFRAYHATIRGVPSARVDLDGRIDWQDCRISGFKRALYGGSGNNGREIIRRNTFSDCGIVFPPGCSFRNVQDCTISKCEVAIHGLSERKESILRNCVFENNKVNVVLKGSRCTLINPKLGEANSPDTVTDATWNGVEYKGRLVVKRHMFVEVVDAAGDPLENAIVEVTNEAADGPAPERGRTITDEDGLTPDSYSGPIVVTDYVQTAPDGGPGTTAYTYAVEVRKGAYKQKIVRNVDPVNTWFDQGTSVRVTLEQAD